MNQIQNKKQEINKNQDKTKSLRLEVKKSNGSHV